MKFLGSIVFLLSILLSISSCKEEVSLVGEFKETPVLVGLLDANDNTHYIKLQRAFIGPGNALEFAKIPDSNYFANVTIKVDEIKNNLVVRTWDLYDTLIENKNPNGVFFAPEQKVYAFKTGGSNGAILDVTATYKVTANINNGQIVVTGTTELVHDLKTSSNNSVLKFATNPGEYNISGLSLNSGTAVTVNAKVEIFYSEETATDSIAKSYIQSLNELVTEKNSLYTVNFSGQTFYEILLSKITTNPAVVQRNILGFEYILVGGSDDLIKYIAANKPSSSLAQTKPTFTNLTVTDGYDVIGIFSSRQTYTYYKPFYQPSAPALRLMDQKSTIELCAGPITGMLSFCSPFPQDPASIKCN